jgi:hypothetical protein
MKLETILEYDWNGEERRKADRRAVPNAISAMADHMHKIKRALDSDNPDLARKLVNGAIKVLTSAQQTPFE